MALSLIPMKTEIPGYSEHLATVLGAVCASLQRHQYDGLVIHNGSAQLRFQDDQAIPFRANPWLSWLAPLQNLPDAMVLVRPGAKPKLRLVIPRDYWHLPPEAPTGDWTRLFDIQVDADPTDWTAQLPPGRWAYLGEPALPSGCLPISALAQQELEAARAYKSEYEVGCMRQATQRALAGHQAAREAFQEGASELHIHLRYLAAAQSTDDELPYHSIVALNEHAATLHYQLRDSHVVGESRSLLIDAGGSCRGYASDITRSYARDTHHDFATLISRMEQLQQGLCQRVAPGQDWRELHLLAVHQVAALLQEAGLINTDAESAVGLGIASAFLPHGLGHLLGLNVHDVAGLRATPGAEPIARPAGHEWLRLTRKLETGFVVTMEPGLYFIPLLLDALRAKPAGRHVNWNRVQQLLPFGGIRIEDNLQVTDRGCINLTRTS